MDQNTVNEITLVVREEEQLYTLRKKTFLMHMMKLFTIMNPSAIPIAVCSIFIPWDPASSMFRDTSPYKE